MSSPGVPGASAPDWPELRRRLDAAFRAATAIEGRDEEQARRVLDERARQLACPLGAGDTGSSLEVVIVTLGGERWALEAGYVSEVFRTTEFVPLPGASPPVAGLTTWRGTVLPALDLRPTLGVPAAGLDDFEFALVVGRERPVMCVLVDSLPEFSVIDRTEVGEPAEGVAVHRDYLLGVTRSSLPVLDVARLVQRYG